MTRYAVVDLEATDAHSSENKIIQIGIALVEGGKIVETYSTEVNPHEPLLPRISELTGLSDKQLKSAPDFSEVASEVRKLLTDSVFVAHNARFDYGLLEKSFLNAGLEFNEMLRVDTVDLARVFYPTFEKYGLEALSEKLDLAHDHPHAAVSDAYATAELLIRIEEKIQKLPRSVLEELLRHSDNLLFESKSFLQEQLDKTKIRPAAFKVVHNIATRKFKSSVSKKNSVANLSANFSENISKLGLASRSKQEKLAHLMETELTHLQASFIEAPTGLGKTYGYLLPLVAAGQRIVVSTATKVLQKQLVNDVAPKLAETFGLKMAKIVGTKNYISLRKFSELLLNNTDGKNFEIFKMKILIWLTETKTGELDEISKVMTNDDYFDGIRHDGYVNTKHFHYEQDFWLRAQKEAEQAEIKVVNHAYLIERLADYPETFLENRVLVVDEAQQLFPIMENAGQKSIKITDELLKIDSESSENPQLTKRLQESLVFQLNKKELDLSKIKIDADELGLTELSALLEADNQIVWRENDILYSSDQDFYNFERLIPKETKLFMLGATLSLSKDKPSFPELLGFKDYRFFKIEGSQATNQELLTMADAPNIKNVSLIDYADYTADTIAELAKLNLPIVVLFTSKMSLTFVAEKLSAEGFDILAQDINGSPAQIKKKFDKGEGKILLGLGSFWEGVDFDKQNQVILVIPRLPFATPDDILTKKYAKKFENPFYDFNVPMATLKMRQAIGRVNRRKNQYSSIVVLDKRLGGKSYAKRMRKNLSEALPVKMLSLLDTISEIKNFLI
ncbi:ATP-dependent helicase dinG-like protein [Lactococcus cremoris subsp. cremoris UC509.9]|uniref:3'-5' exonuclease DinG n=1 Tax=Lactococcus lactis subsp. cremoris TaxID=1359 RepID=A0AAJ6MJ22_LACLC|nr:helicase C-terminal domain-containing protein [Lactococcus cremoris]AFW92244.1 ATP-dependent helicase dinG-like protein [Lactococcus cremoris subsp. cremoris UC509.9]ARD91982.1 helicase C-terminal domain-containing protein [Lactococcus cremoris]QJD18643.1 3'-5' exonuclease [Lactococcus cremoris]QRZ30511.1 ATP-dependent helicase dinG-like protein [Lactococcus cremoris]UXV58311.1 helicase C-terminal domain-containing protein [Lactococcus cremoris]